MYLYNSVIALHLLLLRGVHNSQAKNMIYLRQKYQEGVLPIGAFVVCHDVKKSLVLLQMVSKENKILSTFSQRTGINSVPLTSYLH